MKKWKWEQEQIANMKEYIARFGHGSAKLARQAQVGSHACRACALSGARDGHAGWFAKVNCATQPRCLLASGAIPVRAHPNQPLPAHVCLAEQGEGSGKDGARGADGEGGDRPGGQVQV